MTKLHELLRCDLRSELRRSELCLQMSERLNIDLDYAKRLLEENGYGKVYYNICGVVYVTNDNGKFGAKRASRYEGCVVVEERGVLDLKNFHKDYEGERLKRELARERRAEQRALDELLRGIETDELFYSSCTSRPNKGKCHFKTAWNKRITKNLASDHERGSRNVLPKIL